VAKSQEKQNDTIAKRIVWFAISFTILLGLVAVSLPGSPLLPLSSGSALANLLSNIGYGLIGGGITAAVFQIVAGNTASGQQQQLNATLESLSTEIQKVPAIIETVTSAQQSAIASQEKHFIALSNLLGVANSIGLVAIAASRTEKSFADHMTLVERWVHLLNHAKEVDLLCWDDSRLLNFDVIRDQATRVITRIGNGGLRLRILLSASENKSLPLVDEWIEQEEERFMENRVGTDAKTLESVTRTYPEILRRHDKLLAFTLLRGDNELYIMYFFPGRGAGPILQFAQPETLDTAAGKAGTNLFGAYRSYFEDMWENPLKKQRIED
jgi:hypothetical protein